MDDSDNLESGKQPRRTLTRKDHGTSLLRLLLPLAYMAGIFALSSIPDDGTPETLGEQMLQWATPALQNLLHLPMFGGLAAAWYWALRPIIGGRRSTLIGAFLITGAYAIFDEWHQLQVPGRFGSLTDIALNLIGISIALWFINRRALI